MAVGYTPSQSAILSALSTASDHLPNVADYTYVVPEPDSFALITGAGGLILARRRLSRNARTPKI